MKGVKIQTKTQWFAWAGWALETPRDWRPLDITGDWTHGAIMLGDADQTVLRIRWKRPRARSLDPDRWRRTRMKKLGGTAGMPVADADMPQGFVHTGLLKPGADADDSGWVWAGYAPDPGLIVEAAVNGAVRQAELVTHVTNSVLPSLRAVPSSTPTPWALFETSFRSPPGFVLENRLLHLGDTALHLGGRQGSRLVLRQVYPAKLALARREMVKWLELRPFQSNRRFRVYSKPSSWTVNLGGRRVTGLREDGETRLPAPFGGWRPRHYATAIVQEPDLDRLLLVEFETRSSDPGPGLEQAFADMNWALSGEAPFPAGLDANSATVEKPSFPCTV